MNFYSYYEYNIPQVVITIVELAEKRKPILSILFGCQKDERKEKDGQEAITSHSSFYAFCIAATLFQFIG